VTPPADWLARIVYPTLDDFERSFGSVVDHSWLAMSREALGGLPALPQVFEQRDFSPWNVLINRKGDLMVLDWESAEPKGLPLLDLVYFLTYLTIFRDGTLQSGRFCDSYRRLLDFQSATGAVVHACLSFYADRLELPASVLPTLRMFTWLLHCRSDYRHLVADSAGSLSPQGLRRSVFLRLWQEEMRSWETSLSY